ncbi:aldo/keto reductase [Kamptonema cortianum]|nr:aldo/keto reductase [Kamptonema cortianum]
MTLNSSPFLSRFTFGTANCNDPDNPQHIGVIRQAMEAGVWFHTARMYGRTFEALRKAFDESPAQKPPLIVKVHGEDANQLRGWTEEALAALGVDQIAIAQICGRPRFDDDLQPGCALHEMMCLLKEEGKVGSYILECFRPSSADQIRIVGSSLFAGYIFYYNVVDREVSNLLWDKLLEKKAKIFALRTLGGGPDAMGYAGERSEEFQNRMRMRVEEIFSESGCADKQDFRLRFAISHSHVVTSIGGTSNPEHLERLLMLDSSEIKSLPDHTLMQIAQMHRDFFEN